MTQSLPVHAEYPLATVRILFQGDGREPIACIPQSRRYTAGRLHMLRTPHHSQRIRSAIARFAVCLIALLTLIPNAKSLSQTDNVFSTIEEIQSEFDSVPCRRQDRLPAVRALFQKMGAKPEELTSQKRGT